MVIKSVTGHGVLLEIFFLKIVSNVFVEDSSTTVKVLIFQIIFFQNKVVDDDFESAGLHVGILIYNVFI